MGSFGDIIKDTGAIALDATKSGAARGLQQAEQARNVMDYGTGTQDLTDIDALFAAADADAANQQYLNDVIAAQQAAAESGESFSGIGAPQKTTVDIHSAISNAMAVQDSYLGTITAKEITNSNDGRKGTITPNFGQGNSVFPAHAEHTDKYTFRLPNWGYADYINERNIWVKHLSNGLDEPNWLFCRVFFNFDTYHGLFGGILNNNDNNLDEPDLLNYDGSKIVAVNSAYNYLSQLSKMESLYTVENMQGRKLALQQSVNLLSQINTFSPWIFKGIANANTASNINMKELTQNHSFDLQLGVDTVDWRISTFMSLYKYACYDDINQKEILPDNLRKFDMTVVMFSLPIKYIHTPIMSIEPSGYGNSIQKYYKRLFSLDHNQIMSTKVYNFVGCEFDPENFGSYIPTNLVNDKPFQLGGNNLKINYDRVYEYMYNEYEMILVGSDGIASFRSNDPNTTINKLAEVRSQRDIGNILLTAADYYSLNKLADTFGYNSNFILGNLFGQDRKISNADIDSTRLQITDYFKKKMKLLKGKKPDLMTIGYNMLYKMLETSMKSGTAPSPDGSGTVLAGGGERGIGSKLWQENLKRLLYGDTELTAREKRYNAINNAKNFNLMRFLNNKALSTIK